MLCALLLVWQPLNLGLTASHAVHVLAIRGLPLALLLAGRIVVAGLGIAAGISILRHAPSAISITKVALLLSAAFDVLVYTTPYYPNNRLPGDTALFVGGSLVYYGIWLAYLSRSRRVRATFPSP
jgi:hypothetical protein